MVDQLDRLGRDLVDDLDEIAASIPQAPRGLGILRQVMALLPPPLGATTQPSFPADELSPPEQAVDTMAGPSPGSISGASIIPGTIGTPQIAPGAITMAAMRTGVRPIQIVDVLPVLPDPAYPPAGAGTTGSIVLLTTDGKLYRNVGDAWTAEVPAVDITGITETIRENAIEPVGALPALPDADYPVGRVVYLTTDGKLYRNVADVWTAEVPATDVTGLTEAIREDAIEGVGALPALPDADYPIGRVVYLTTDGKLYRNVANAWTTAVAGADVTGTVANATNAVNAAVAAVALVADEVAAADITGQIVEAQIAANAVTTAKIAADAVTAAQIAANAVGTLELDALAVTGAKIAANTITAAKIAAATITTAEIAAGTIVAGNIAAGTITSAEIAALTIVAGNIAAGTITAAKLVAHTLTANEIAALTITAAEIAAATITGAKIAANTITAANITALTITAAEIAANAITTTKLDALAVTAAKIAANTITAAQIAALTITAAEIAAGTITAAKIAAATITGDRLVAGTITANEIAATTITAAKIAALTITAAQIAANTITAGQIAADTITAGQIAAGAIGTSELVVGATFTGIVQNAAVGATIVINSSGIAINNGALVLQDENGSTQMTSTGFAGAWADFIRLGLYNGNFTAGQNGLAATGRTSNLPYWTIANTAGTPNLTYVAATDQIEIQFSAINTGKKITSDLVPVSEGGLVTYGLRYRFDRTAGTLKITLGIEWTDDPTGAGSFIGGLENTVSITAGAGGFEDSLEYTDAPTERYARVYVKFEELVSHNAANKITAYAVWAQPSATTGSYLTLLDSLTIDNAGVSGVAVLSITGDDLLVLGSDVAFQRTAAKTLTLQDGAAATLTAVDFLGALLRGFSGTSFPASPADKDLFYRTDNDMWWRYRSGITKWVCTCPHELQPTMTTTTTLPIAATASDRWRSVFPQGRPATVLIEESACYFQVQSGGTALGASHKWVGTVSIEPAGTTVSTLNIASGASATDRVVSDGTDTQVTVTTNFSLRINWTKTGTPGDLRQTVVVSYRYVL